MTCHLLVKLREQFIEEKIKPIVTKAGKELIDMAHSEGKKLSSQLPLMILLQDRSQTYSMSQS